MLQALLPPVLHRQLPDLRRDLQLQAVAVMASALQVLEAPPPLHPLHPRPLLLPLRATARRAALKRPWTLDAAMALLLSSLVFSPDSPWSCRADSR